MSDMTDFESDVLVDFHYSAQNKRNNDNKNKQNKSDSDNSNEYQGRTLFGKGARHGDLEVLGPASEPTRSATGRPLTDRRLKVKCHLCGRTVSIGYNQLYNGGEILTNCGCKPWHKHPPMRLEERVIGRLQVIEWDHDKGYWHCVCTECLAAIYRRKMKDIRASADGCETHQQEYRPVL